MVFVLDTSVTMTWCFQDEAAAYGDQVLEWLKNGAALAPAIWPLEVANILLVGERRGRFREGQEATFLDLIQQLPITVDALSLERALGEVLSLAREQRLSSYDATYLELAARTGLPLATQDTRLTAAAGRLGVPLVEPPSP